MGLPGIYQRSVLFCDANASSTLERSGYVPNKSEHENNDTDTALVLGSHHQALGVRIGILNQLCYKSLIQIRTLEKGPEQKSIYEWADLAMWLQRGKLEERQTSCFISEIHHPGYSGSQMAKQGRTMQWSEHPLTGCCSDHQALMFDKDSGFFVRDKEYDPHIGPCRFISQGTLRMDFS